MKGSWPATGGLVGPLAFTASWWLLGRRRTDYSPRQEPISRLAADGVATRRNMTAGFLAYGAGVGAYAPVLARSAPKAGGVLRLNAASMLAVAGFPLDAEYGDGPHVAAATLAYVTLALVPILAGGDQPGRVRRSGRAVGGATGALLALSQIDSRRRGMWQRLGLGLGHSWIVASAIAAGR